MSEQFRRRCETPMSLSRALGVQDGDVVSFVGAGGKTSLMLRLATELSQAGKSVLLTTTTKMWRRQTDSASELVVGEEIGPILQRLRSGLRNGSMWATGRRVDGNGKLLGVPEDWVEDFRRLSNVTNVLVEADGAAGRSLKAPAEHEPVIPGCSAIVIVVAGIDVLAKPVAGEHVHRPEIASRLAGIPLEAELTPAIVARILTHPGGGAKGCPGGARLWFALNKVDRAGDLVPARALASEVLLLGGGQIVLTTCRSEHTVVEVLSSDGPAGKSPG